MSGSVSYQGGSIADLHGVMKAVMSRRSYARFELQNRIDLAWKVCFVASLVFAGASLILQGRGLTFFAGALAGVVSIVFGAVFHRATYDRMKETWLVEAASSGISTEEADEIWFKVMEE